MVFKREDALKSITDGLAWIAASCETRGLLHLFDSNTLAHHFFCRLLNELYGLKLEVMDRIVANFPAIDLGDAENRRAYQITTEKSGPKVQQTLDTFVRHGLQARFDKLQVLVIGKKQARYTALTIPQGISFDPEEDILDHSNLVADTEALPTLSLQEVAHVFDEELQQFRNSAPENGGTPQATSGNDIEIRRVVSSLLTFLEDRRVLYVPFACKCPRGVVASVREIRDRLQADLESLPRNSILHNILAAMRRHVHDFLAYACQRCEGPICCEDCTIYLIGCTEGLGVFRRMMGAEIAKICTVYNMAIEGQLSASLLRDDERR